MLNVWRRLFLGGLTTACALSARASDYPRAPIKIILPYPAGGTGDNLFRLLGNQVEKQTSISFTVLNTAGASGNIGTLNVVRSAPDGYTLLCAALNNFVTNQYLTPLQFDPLRDLVPIVRLGNGPVVFFSNPKVPAKTLGEFIALAKREPGRLNYASTGIGTTTHLHVELLKQVSGIDIQHVPYPGAPQIMPDLMRNEVQLFAGSLSVAAGLLDSGAVTALAVAWPERISGYPNIPTTAEAGIRDFIAANWFAVAAPKNTANEIIDLLNTEFVRAMRSSGMRERYIQLGYIPDLSSPSELISSFQTEANQWEGIVKRLGIAAGKL